MAGTNDCSFDGKWPIDDTANVTFKVKGVLWSISQLLDDGLRPPLLRRCLHALVPGSHRQHAPVSGRVIEKVIPGLCYLQVVLQTVGGAQPRLTMHRKMRPMHMADENPPLFRPRPSRRTGSLRT